MNLISPSPAVLRRLHALPMDLRIRVASKIKVRKSGCWRWIGKPTDKGYSVLNWKGRTLRVHKLVYEAVVGCVPAGLQLDHLCRNRGCVNPKHLEVVTSRENTMRGKSFVVDNARKTHCPQGHEYTDDNTQFRLGRRYCRACKRARKREAYWKAHPTVQRERLRKRPK